MSSDINSEIEEYTNEVIMTILHIMRNLKVSGVEMMEEVELSFPQALVLYLLFENTPLTMSEIASWLGLSQSVTTRTVDRLVEKGLAERKRRKEDRRVVMVYLSEKGKDFGERMIALHLESVGKIFMRLSREKRKFFLELLKQIDRELEEPIGKS
jgi:DNA-binding MarR family transcriptional regulator